MNTYAQAHMSTYESVIKKEKEKISRHTQRENKINKPPLFHSFIEKEMKNKPHTKNHAHTYTRTHTHTHASLAAFVGS